MWTRFKPYLQSTEGSWMKWWISADALYGSRLGWSAAMLKRTAKGRRKANLKLLDNVNVLFKWVSFCLLPRLYLKTCSWKLQSVVVAPCLNTFFCASQVISSTKRMLLLLKTKKTAGSGRRTMATTYMNKHPDDLNCISCLMEAAQLWSCSFFYISGILTVFLTFIMETQLQSAIA